MRSVSVIVRSSVAIAAVSFLAFPASVASAAPATIGSFPTWSMTRTTDAGLTYRGSADFADAAAFPDVAVRTNSTTVKTPSGDSAWLGDSTGFGMNFGSSRAQPYLYLSPATSGPSTTVLTFDSAPPPGWGLAVGDIDADYVQVIPRDADGEILPGSVLGAQDTGGTPLLNYCNNTPKPSTCTQPAPYEDFPLFWQSGTTITTPAGTTTYTTPVVEGHGGDSNGSYDWFLPSTDVRSITLIFTVKSGFPTYTVWLAAPAPVATITGTIVVPDENPVPAETTVLLEQPDGTPVLDIENNPVTTPIDPDGRFSIPTEQGRYRLEFDVPDGFDPIPPIEVDATSATVDLGEIALEPAATDPDPTDPTDPGDGETGGQSADRLPPTGFDPAISMGLSALALVGGAAALLTSARLRRRSHH